HDGDPRSRCYARSWMPATPASIAQWAQQKHRPSPASTPWPTIRHPQCPQRGASAWMVHSKLSNVWFLPAMTTSKDLSYSLPQTSHWLIAGLPADALLQANPIPAKCAAAIVSLRHPLCGLILLLSKGDGHARERNTGTGTT